MSFAGAARKLAAWGASIKQDTVILYIGYLKSTFALFDISRLDWKTGRYFDTTRKYYAVDTGIASLFRSSTENRSFLLENAVYLELRRRGFEIRFGAIENGKELDFICPLPGREWLKIQTARRLTDENRSRELASFVLAQEHLTQGEALLLLEEGGRQRIEREGVTIRAEPMIRWMLGI
jgi:predicted AAA+ superfamily ATPase